MNQTRIENECRAFLIREAELLDNRKLHEWLGVLSRDIEYRVPIRTTRLKNAGSGFSGKAFFLDEDYGSLEMRISRLDSEFAWSENPSTRTRRLITNFRLENVEKAGETDQATIFSNMAVFVYRGESAVPAILTGERQDVLLGVNGEWRLLNRLVLLDSTTLGMESLSIFL